MRYSALGACLAMQICVQVIVHEKVFQRGTGDRDYSLGFNIFNGTVRVLKVILDMFIVTLYFRMLRYFVTQKQNRLARI